MDWWVRENSPCRPLSLAFSGGFRNSAQSHVVLAPGEQARLAGNRIDNRSNGLGIKSWVDKKEPEDKNSHFRSSGLAENSPGTFRLPPEWSSQKVRVADFNHSTFYLQASTARPGTFCGWLRNPFRTTWKPCLNPLSVGHLQGITQADFATLHSAMVSKHGDSRKGPSPSICFFAPAKNEPIVKAFPFLNQQGKTRVCRRLPTAQFNRVFGSFVCAQRKPRLHYETRGGGGWACSDKENGPRPSQLA